MSMGAMTTTAAALVIGILMGANAGAEVKTPTPAPSPTPVAPFQTVQVGDFAYSVDPYYVCVVYLVRRVEELSGPSVVSSTVTLQPFFREGEQMVAGAAYDTHDSEILSDVRVGQALICDVQRAVTPEAGQ